MVKCLKEERLKWTKEAERIIEGLTLEEKISLMSGNLTVNDLRDGAVRYWGGVYYLQNIFLAGGIKEKNVPAMRFCDGTGGIYGGKGHTLFPSAVCRGASFDRILEKRIGNALGKETKARNGNVYAGVCINLPYHPGWGRSQETYGEDSWHIGEMGSALVEGIQEENVIACIKHFAFNSMEFSRFRVDINCDIRTEREVFLPHFKKCIDHGAAAVMSAYNSYRGSWCGQNDYLLNQVLKGEWGFDGFVMSDFLLGIRDTSEAANNGMDMEMCASYLFGEPLIRAVKSGSVQEERINDAVVRILRTLLAFERRQADIDEKRIFDAKEHVNLALQAAREGITLIKNDNVLPLQKEKIQKVVVLGRLAQQENKGDHSGLVNVDYVVTPVQGIANIAPNAEVIHYSGSNLKHSKKLAQNADAVIFVVGYDEEDEGEYVGFMDVDEENEIDSNYPGDRKDSLSLHEEEIELLKTVGPINKNSVAVMIGGGMIMIEKWKEEIGSILMAYYPGMEGGTAIAEIIFGDVNPSGKLPYVVPCCERDLPDIIWETDQQTYGYYHGYTKLEKDGKEPSVPFGFGLSYTTFHLENEKFEVADNMISASCDIKNTGKYDGDEIIQMYVGFSNSQIGRPVKELRGFKRISLKRNETKKVVLTCPLDEIRWYNPASGEMELEHMEYEVFIGTSSSNKDLLKGNLVI